MRLFQLILLTWLVAVTSPARAQGVAGDVYADARDIIVELIERDIAEALGADMACYSPDGLLKYFPSTLQAVYERNFGAVKEQLRREAVGFATNYSFECFRQQRSIPLEQFLPIASFDPQDSSTNACRTAVQAAGGPANYQESLARARRARDLLYYPIDRCESEHLRKAGVVPGIPHEPKRVQALCPYVAALRAASGGRMKNGLVAFAEAASTLAYGSWREAIEKPATGAGSTIPDSVHTALFDEVLQRLTSGSFPKSSLLEPFTAEKLEEALELSDQDLPAIFARTSPDVRVLAGALRLLREPGLPAEIALPGGLLDGLPTFLKASALDSLPAQAGDVPGSAMGRALLAHAGIVAKGTVKVRLTSAGVEFTLDDKGTGPPLLVGDGLARLVELQKMAQQAVALERLLSALGLETDGTQSALIRLAVKATIGLVQSVQETVTALKAVPRNADGTVDLLTLLDALIRPEQGSGFCAQDPPDVAAGAPVMNLTLCGLLRQAIAISDPQGLLLPILSAALERDYRRVAVAVTDSVFSDASIEAMCCGKQASCEEAARLYGRLAKSIVSYVLMPRGDEDQSLAARAAFKSAAVDVIREIGKRGGIDRRGWKGFLLPTGSLRASWSSSYQLTDRNLKGLRVMPTIDFPNLRFPLTPQGSVAYLGVTISLFDPLAPFTEVVSRNQAFDYANKGDAFWSVIHPRVSTLLAIPWLTKHTAIAVGAGLRGAAPFEQGVNAQGKPKFVYAPLWGNDQTDNLDTGARLLPMVELSAGVQYIP